jgi:hypothetical protein
MIEVCASKFDRCSGIGMKKASWKTAQFVVQLLLRKGGDMSEFDRFMADRIRKAFENYREEPGPEAMASMRQRLMEAKSGIGKVEAGDSRKVGGVVESGEAPNLGVAAVDSGVVSNVGSVVESGEGAKAGITAVDSGVVANAGSVLKSGEAPNLGGNSVRTPENTDVKKSVAGVILPYWFRAAVAAMLLVAMGASIWWYLPGATTPEIAYSGAATSAHEDVSSTHSDADTDYSTSGIAFGAVIQKEGGATVPALETTGHDEIIPHSSRAALNDEFGIESLQNALMNALDVDVDQVSIGNLSGVESDPVAMNNAPEAITHQYPLNILNGVDSLQVAHNDTPDVDPPQIAMSNLTGVDSLQITRSDVSGADSLQILLNDSSVADSQQIALVDTTKSNSLALEQSQNPTTLSIAALRTNGETKSVSHRADYRESASLRQTHSEGSSTELIVGSISSFSDEQLAAGLGITAGASQNWSVTRGVSISAGAQLSYNRFGVDSNINIDTQSITLSDAGSEFSTNLINRVNYDLLAVEIPVNLTFDLSRRPAGTIALTTGVSSLWYVRQSFSDEMVSLTGFVRTNSFTGDSESVVRTATSTQTESAEPFSRFDPAGLLNLSIGFTPESNRWPISFDVYIKYPLTNLTDREITFGMGGITLRYRVR